MVSVLGWHFLVVAGLDMLSSMIVHLALATAMLMLVGRLTLL